MMNRFKVVITDLMKDALDPERRVLEDLADVTALDAHREEDLVGKVENADALMVHHNIRLTERTISRLTRCKVIVRAGVGFDNIDHRQARQQNIPVANVPDYGTEEVADAALALTLALVRGVHLLNSKLRGNTGPWNFTQAVPLMRLRGRVFGVVGFGAIGMAAARRAQAFGMTVKCYDPFLRAGFDKAAGIERVGSLETLLEQIFVLSLHCGLNKETFHLINDDRLARMPRGSYLVNTARGALVETAAVPAAIESGQLAGAGFDVVEGDPPAADDPLICAWRNPLHPAHHRAIINPHAAFYSEQAVEELRTKAALACRHALLEQAIPNVVN